MGGIPDLVAMWIPAWSALAANPLDLFGEDLPGEE